MTAAIDPVVRHAADRQRYELVVEGAAPGPDVIGFTEYRPATDGVPRRVFFHTVVDAAYEGQGLAGRLVTAALDDTVAAGLRIVPVCPYVAAFLRRHHEWDEQVDRVQAADLAVVPS
ncbi:GNAT family N-acetyltransferase [Cellulomonas soli]|uniref:GNAT family N-acetyltransferase n=1 Tax=Cellulomonas soli TaxID=931535 RepID=UPI003F83C9AF